MLWRRVNRGLSAGRVQSPSIRLIVERERERIAFVAAGYWDIELTTATAPSFTADLVAVDGARVATGKDFDADGRPGANVVVLDEARARSLADGLEPADFTVRSVEEKPYRSQPQGAVHDHHPAAGGRPQAAAVGVAGDARRPGPVRARLHHLHAHRHRDAVATRRISAVRAADRQRATAPQFLSPSAASSTRRR